MGRLLTGALSWHADRMHAHTEQVIERPSDLTASWLTAAIGCGPVADFAVERIGTGQMSECYRIRLNYTDAGTGGPKSVVLKVAATDAMSRQTGLALGLYEREVGFYGDIAPRLPVPMRSTAKSTTGPQPIAAVSQAAVRSLGCSMTCSVSACMRDSVPAQRASEKPSQAIRRCGCGSNSTRLSRSKTITARSAGV